MLTNDLNRYHPDFVVSVVDQILEDIRRGLEQNVYSTNQRRVATAKFLGELYNYRLLNSGIIFDMLWSLVTFGHRKDSTSLVVRGVVKTLVYSRRSPLAWPILPN
jgi:regulator of nonsense transcripts 2